MTQKVQLWEIRASENGDKLARIEESAIDYEQQLEDWLEEDISILDRNLLVIGRQVPTDYRGSLDLLCLHRSGDIAVVELKKDRTPRDVTAQILDYASWARDLSRERILKISETYLKQPLADAFPKSFDDEELPEDLNLSHQSIIVARSSDDSTERIVRYLSDLGVPINVATFQHFVDDDNHRLVARIFSIEPEETETNARASVGRNADRTIAAVSKLAHEHGIGDLYDYMRESVKGIFRAWSSYVKGAACEMQHEDRSWRRLLFIEAMPADGNSGLPVTVHATRIERYFGCDVDSISRALPSKRVEATEVRDWGKRINAAEPDAEGFKCYFTDIGEIDRFVDLLKSPVSK